mmetsp:Transcript_11598/g.16249  ORF Transcript_11598/g.16249 Transcript_11598/m.16249 type:complete len:322 (-) Transcript_11598:164-1129(-)
MNQTSPADSSLLFSSQDPVVYNNPPSINTATQSTTITNNGMVSTVSIVSTKSQQYHCTSRRSTSPKHSRYTMTVSNASNTSGSSSTSRTVSPRYSPSQHAVIIKDEDEAVEPCQEESKQQASMPKPSDDESMNPDAYLKLLVETRYGLKPVFKPTLDLSDNDFFTPITPEQLAAYTNEIVLAGRDGDVATLKKMYLTSGHRMECCNRFGESLLHMACRRGFQDMAQFLLVDEEGPQLSVRIRDDCGRTPFHDACWCAVPNLSICKWLLERDPSLLLMSDKRGHTPFQYARQQHWGTWKQFLYDNVDLLNALSKEEYKSVFC